MGMGANARGRLGREEEEGGARAPWARSWGARGLPVSLSYRKGEASACGVNMGGAGGGGNKASRVLTLMRWGAYSEEP
jgi:hypothetical protein